MSYQPHQLHAVSVAPMMGCTDRHCRFLFRQLSPNAMLYSEMLTAAAILHGNTDRLLAHRADEPVALQLGGSNPDDLARAAGLGEQHGYQEINLNCGCPSDRVQQGGIGACLMAEPALVARCYRSMSENVGIPVSIKSRIGIDDRDDYGFFRDFVGHQVDAGCRLFHVHARKAVLSGLSPKENREIPPLKYDFVRRIANEFPEADFVLNGGIRTTEESLDLLRDFAGVMLGRAPYSNPFLLAELEYAVHGNPLPHRLTIAEKYCDYMQKEMTQGVHLKHMAKHMLGLFTAIPGARAYRRHLSTHMYDDSADLSVVEQALRFIRQEPELDTGT